MTTLSSTSNQTNNVESIAFINNPISLRMLQAAMKAEHIDPSRSVLFVLRALPKEGYWDDFAQVVVYPHQASLNLLGQLKFFPFYSNAGRILKRAIASKKLKHIFVINNDNILTNHALGALKEREEVHVSVIAEGLMNYQDIQLANRAWWRNLSRPVISRLLGLHWHHPVGHLSGAFEPAVESVFAFAEPGLFAPSGKAKIIPFESVASKSTLDNHTVLFIETALWQWMSDSEFRVFADSFAAWLKSLGSIHLLVKPHPNYPASEYLRGLLPPYQVLTEAISVEAMADKIEASRVVGFCCTGLVTLSLLRPDVSCIDFGYDYYLERAYRGDRNLIQLMQAVGVQMIPFSRTSNN